MNPVYKSYDDKFVAYYPVYVRNSPGDAFKDPEYTIPMTSEELIKAFFAGCRIFNSGSPGFSFNPICIEMAGPYSDATRMFYMGDDGDICIVTVGEETEEDNTPESSDDLDPA